MVDQEQENNLLPIANVGRIMKQILPPNAKISKEAKQTMQECATEFISFVTGEASDKCQKENRKTVNGDDICWALSALGLDDYAETVIRYLHKYREHEREKSSSASHNSNSKDPNKGLLFLGTNNTNSTDSQEDEDQKDDDYASAAATATHHHHVSHDVLPTTTLEFRIIEKGMSSSSPRKDRQIM